MARTGDSAVLMTPGAAVGQEAAHATVERETRRAVLRLSLGLAVIVMTPILFRLSALGPTATAFHRTFFAIPLFAAWMALERRSAMRRGEIVAPLRLQRDGLALVIGGVFFAANIVGYAWAVHFTSVANASLLSNIMPAPDHPILDSTLTHFFQRLTQSQAIVDARTKNRIWPAFRNTADYQTMSLDVPCRRERN